MIKMLVFPMALLKYLLIIAGIYCLYDGQTGAGVGLIAVGVIWILIKHSGGSGNKDTTQTNAGNVSSTEKKDSKPQTENNSHVSQLPKIKQETNRKCSHCGVVIPSNHLFCENCGASTDEEP